MMRYIPAAAAEPLSAHLWQLSDPHHLGQTPQLFSWVDDIQGSRWLIVNPEFTILVHVDAELDGIVAILQPWNDQGHLPTDTIAQLTALIERSRGGLLTVYDAFPQLFKDMSKSYAEMIELGHLPTPPIQPD